MLLQVLIISKMAICLADSIDHCTSLRMLVLILTMAFQKKARTDVWQHYKLVEGEKVLCMLCNPHKKISYHSCTSYFTAPFRIQENTTAKQTSLLHFSKRSCCSESPSKEITKLIIELVIRDVQPLRFAEGAEFLQLMSFIEPAYKVQSFFQIHTLKTHVGKN